VAFLIGVVIVASKFGIAATQFISLFPLVILTHLVERFWTVENEDGAWASFRTLLGTLVVGLVVSLCLGHPEVGDWMFRHPETLGLVIAAQFLVGRYTGYRLSELYRFEYLIRPEEPKGEGTDELADARPAAGGAGHSRHEPAEHAVHPGP
jgi:hypothetical protein